MHLNSLLIRLKGICKDVKYLTRVKCVVKNVIIFDLIFDTDQKKSKSNFSCSVTYGVRGIVPSTIDDNVTSEVGTVVDNITSGEEVTADDGVTSGICSVEVILVANFERKGFHLVIFQTKQIFFKKFGKGQTNKATV